MPRPFKVSHPNLVGYGGVLMSLGLLSAFVSMECQRTGMAGRVDDYFGLVDTWRYVVASLRAQQNL